MNRECHRGDNDEGRSFFSIHVWVLSAGTSSWLRDTQSQTPPVWTFLPSFLPSLRTQDQTQMKVCLEKSLLNKYIFPHTQSSQLFINQNNTSELTEKIIKLMYLPHTNMLCYVYTWKYVYSCYKNSKIMCATVGSAPPCENIARRLAGCKTWSVIIRSIVLYVQVYYGTTDS